MYEILVKPSVRLKLPVALCENQLWLLKMETELSRFLCVVSLEIKAKALVMDTQPQMSYWLFVIHC